MPSFHPEEEVLMDYAAGSLPEATSLVVATHLALCPRCRGRVAELEALGGALFEALEPADLGGGALDRVLSRLDEAPAGAVEPSPREDRPDLRVPRPLRDYLTSDLDSLSWHRVMPGMEEVEVETASPGIRARLMRVGAGRAMPSHTHGGEEYTLVLTGGYQDASGHYLRGDVQSADPEVDHRPVADRDEPCICLVVSDAPIRLTGRFGRLLNPLISYK